MAEEKTSTEWRVIGETVPGASHLRAGVPNQDSLLFVRESSRGLPVVLSVSDGHGSPKCFRSDRGSQFAVKKAAFLVSQFLDEQRGSSGGGSSRTDPAEIESQKEPLVKEFVRRWREAVEADLKREPFTEEEFETLEKKSDAKARDLVEENPLLAYGATSLTVAVEEDFILYLQLGDGDILNVSAGGEVTKPLSDDPRLLANETTSLCLPKPEKDFRFFVQEISADRESPAMILLSTDGYLNSFSTEAGFFQAGTDILEMLKAENGFNDVNDNLKAWLEEATRMGSGDDCTVAIIYRPDKLKQPEKTEQPENIETIVSEKPPSAETSQAIAALTDSETITPDMEDVTVTITIQKDKNKKAVTSVQPKTGSASSKQDIESDKDRR